MTGVLSSVMIEFMVTCTLESRARSSPNCTYRLALYYTREMEDIKEWFVFSIADHLNHASRLLVTNEDKLDYGQCNLRAADVTMRKSADRMAADYACRGLA